MPFDIVYAGRFYMDHAFQYLEVGVVDGKISRIGKNLRGERKKELDGAIMPAGTDIHVHFRDPGEINKEDFRSGTTSAAFGGTTTIFDMPNNRVPVSDYSSFDDKLVSVRNRAFVDFGLYSLFTGSNSGIIDERSSGIKIYLGGSTNSLPIGNIRTREKQTIAEMGIPVVFHGEDAECLAASRMDDVSDLRKHNLSRPEICELKSSDTISGLNIPRSVMGHVSTPESLTRLNEGILAEVTPHHLLLNEEMEIGSWGKVNPPLREKKTQENNLQAYLDGKYSILSSDHAPHTERDKEEFIQAPSGIIGVETRIPLMLALVQKKVLDLGVLYDTAIQNPANLFRLKKGKIEPGYWADFMNFRFSDMKRINQERLHSKTPVTPFDGADAVFPRNVTMHGEFVIDDGEIVDDRMGRHTKELEP